LTGCANNESFETIKINTKDSTEFINILSRAQIMFAITKKTGKVKFLEALRYDTDYYDDEKEWKENVVGYGNKSDVILGCIDVDEYNMFGGKGLYRNCRSNNEYKLTDVSKIDMIKVLHGVRYDINKEYEKSKNNIVKAEKLLSKFHLSPTEVDTLQIQLIHHLEAYYKQHKSSTNYFKLHNLIYNYYSAFYTTDWDKKSEANKKYQKNRQHQYLIKAYQLSTDKREKEMIRNMAMSYSDFLGFDNFVDSSNDVDGYKAFLKYFGIKANQKMIRHHSEVYYYLDNKSGKLDIDTIDKLLKSSYYRNVLMHKTPNVSTGYSNEEYYFQLKYNVSNEIMKYKYAFKPVCKYLKTTTQVEDLGFFEVFGTGGMAESKNVTYKVYSCNLKQSDRKKIISFENKLGIDDFSKVLNTAPWTKYVPIAKSYNKSTYIPPASASNGSSQVQHKSSANVALSTTEKSSVKEFYVGATTSQGKQYVIRCSNGNSINGVHQKGSGYWYSSSSNMGDRFKNLSINAVAEAYCR